MHVSHNNKIYACVTQQYDLCMCHLLTCQIANHDPWLLLHPPHGFTSQVAASDASSSVKARLSLALAFDKENGQMQMQPGPVGEARKEVRGRAQGEEMAQWNPVHVWMGTSWSSDCSLSPASLPSYNVLLVLQWSPEMNGGLALHG